MSDLGSPLARRLSALGMVEEIASGKEVCAACGPFAIPRPAESARPERCGDRRGIACPWVR
jgi:hypothetical protein